MQIYSTGGCGDGYGPNSLLDTNNDGVVDAGGFGKSYCGWASLLAPYATTLPKCGGTSSGGTPNKSSFVGDYCGLPKNDAYPGPDAVENTVYGKGLCTDNTYGAYTHDAYNPNPSLSLYAGYCEYYIASSGDVSKGKTLNAVYSRLTKTKCGTGDAAKTLNEGSWKGQYCVKVNGVGLAQTPPKADAVLTCKAGWVPGVYSEVTKVWDPVLVGYATVSDPTNKNLVQCVLPPQQVAGPGTPGGGGNICGSGASLQYCAASSDCGNADGTWVPKGTCKLSDKEGENNSVCTPAPTGFLANNASFNPTEGFCEWAGTCSANNLTPGSGISQTDVGTCTEEGTNYANACVEKDLKEATHTVTKATCVWTGATLTSNASFGDIQAEWNTSCATYVVASAGDVASAGVTFSLPTRGTCSATIASSGETITDVCGTIGSVEAAATSKATQGACIELLTGSDVSISSCSASASSGVTVAFTATKGTCTYDAKDDGNGGYELCGESDFTLDGNSGKCISDDDEVGLDDCDEVGGVLSEATAGYCIETVTGTDVSSDNCTVTPSEQSYGGFNVTKADCDWVGVTIDASSSSANSACAAFLAGSGATNVTFSEPTRGTCSATPIGSATNAANLCKFGSTTPATSSATATAGQCVWEGVSSCSEQLTDVTGSICKKTATSPADCSVTGVSSAGTFVPTRGDCTWSNVREDYCLASGGYGFTLGANPETNGVCISKP